MRHGFNRGRPSRSLIAAGAAWLVLVAAPFQAQQPASVSRSDNELRKAVSQFEKQDYEAARKTLEALRPRLANQFGFNELLGLVYAAENKNEDALPYLEQAVRLNPRSALARTNLANCQMRLRNMSAAEAEFKKAIQIEPSSYAANHDLGELYIRTRRLDDALPYLQKAQQARPSAYDNGYDLALAEFDSGDWNQAKVEIESLLPLHNTAELHELLAETEEAEKNYLAAEKEFELAAHMDPSENNLFAWGSELLLHHTLEPAVQVFTQAVALHPRSPKLQSGLGVALFARSHYKRAIEAFCRAVDLDPTDPRPYVFLGKIYDISPSQASEVTERLAQFVRLQPQNAQACYYYAMSLWKGVRSENRTTDLAAIQSLLKEAITLDPSMAQAYLELGIFYAEKHQYAAAVGEYREAIRRDPALADAHYRLGEALIRLGKRPEADRELQTFRRLQAKQTVEKDKQRSEILEFVLTTEKDQSHRAGSP